MTIPGRVASTWAVLITNVKLLLQAADDLLQMNVPMFRAGDVVSIMEDRVEVSKLQKGHGEWREDMTAVSIWLCNRWYLEFSTVVHW